MAKYNPVKITSENNVVEVNPQYNVINVNPITGVVEVSYPGIIGPQGPSGSSQPFVSGSGNTFTTTSSLEITGSVSSTGGFTGSLKGTASWANNALTASFFSGSISNAAFATSASYASSSTSASYALTASFALNAGTQINTGSFVTTSSFNVFTSSYNTGSFTGSFTGSLLGTSSWSISSSQAISSSFALTASFALNAGTTVNTSSFVTTSSFNSYTQSINSFTSSYNTGSFTGSFTGSLSGTASWAQNAISASWAPTNTTGSFTGSFTGSVQGTSSWAISSSQALTASFYGGSVTSASYASSSTSASFSTTSSLPLRGIITASATNTTITFTKGDGTTFDVTVSQSGSVATASYALFAETASLAPNYTLLTTFNNYTGSARTGSFTGSFTGSVLGTSSWSINSSQSVSSSQAISSSFALTASFALNAGVSINTGSFVTTSSFNSYTQSINTFTSSYNTGSFTGSFTGSILGTSSWAVSSSFAITSSLPLRGITTASAANTTITFTRGDGTTFDVTVSQSGSVATASYALFAETASLAPNYTLLTDFNNYTGSARSGSFTGSFTGSLLGTASWAVNSSQSISSSYSLNGGVTQLLAGPNVVLSPTNGLGQVTISATLSGSTGFNTATGSYGSFYDTTTQTNPVANIPRSMSFNTTDITNGVSISGSTSPFNTYIKTENAGIYNIQFSAQVDKTDGGTDDIVIWLRKNGIDLTDTATTLTLPTNNSKVVAAWNWFVTSATNDYYQIIWRSDDIDLRLLAEPISIDHPGIPSVILTVNRIDQFLSNTGSFTGSFTGSVLGTSSWSISSSTAITSSFAETASLAPNYTLLTTFNNYTGSARTGSFTGSFTGSLLGTSSWALSSSQSISSSFATSASFAPTNTTGSFTGSFTGSVLGTSSYANNALSSSYALTASFALNAGTQINTGSFVTTSSFNSFTQSINSFTSSYNTGSFTGSFTGSLLGTASYATNSLTASFALNAPGGSTTGSFTGSFTGSLLGTSSWAESASFALTASYALNAGSGGNTQIYIDQSPDNGTYGTLTGSIDGSNSTFTVSQGVYISGTLVVAINGQVLTQGGSQDWVETTPSSGTFTFNTAPPSGSVLTAWYNKTVVVGANFTSGTALPSGGNDGDIYLQYV